jgi:hypothetical protein
VSTSSSKLRLMQSWFTYNKCNSAVQVSFILFLLLCDRVLLLNNGKPCSLGVRLDPGRKKLTEEERKKNAICPLGFAAAPEDKYTCTMAASSGSHWPLFLSRNAVFSLSLSLGYTTVMFPPPLPRRGSKPGIGMAVSRCAAV